MKEKNSAVTPEVILTELEKTLSTDARADVYVKWQLLSGIDGKFPEALTARAIRAYRNTPSRRIIRGSIMIIYRSSSIEWGRPRLILRCR